MSGLFNNNTKSQFAFVAIAFVFTYAVIVAIDFNGLYGQDSHAYYSYTKSILNWWHGGQHPGYFFWTSLYPFTCALLSLLIKPIVAMQLVSILSHVLATFFLGKFLSLKYEVKNGRAQVYVLLFYFLSPYVFRLATTAMSDSLCILFLTISLFLSHQLETKRTVSSFFLFGLCISSAILTRYAAIIPGVILLSVTAFSLRHHLKLQHIMAALIGFALAILPEILIRQNVFNSIATHQWVSGWSPVNFFKNDFFTVEGHSHFKLPNLLYVFTSTLHPGFIFCGIIFVIFLFNRITFSQTSKISIIIVITYAFFLAGIPFQNTRFLCLTFPFVVVLFFPAFNAFINSFNLLKHKRVLTASVIIIQCALIFFAMKPFVAYNKEERKIAGALNKTNYHTIYTFSINQALKSYDVKQNIISLYDSSITSMETDAAVLFNENKFALQWKDRLPMQNWKHLQEKYQLVKVADYGNGWELYEAK